MVNLLPLARETKRGFGLARIACIFSERYLKPETGKFQPFGKIVLYQVFGILGCLKGGNLQNGFSSKASRYSNPPKGYPQSKTPPHPGLMIKVTPQVVGLRDTTTFSDFDNPQKPLK